MVSPQLAASSIAS